MTYLLRIVIHHRHHLVALLQSRFDTVAKTRDILIAGTQTVYHQLDRVIAIAVELHAVSQFGELAIDPYIEITLLAQILEEFLIVSLTILDDRGEDGDLATLILLRDHIDDLLTRIFHHLLAGDITSRLPHAGEE